MRALLIIALTSCGGVQDEPLAPAGVFQVSAQLEANTCLNAPIVLPPEYIDVKPDDVYRHAGVRSVYHSNITDADGCRRVLDKYLETVPPNYWATYVYSITCPDAICGAVYRGKFAPVKP